MCFFQVPKKTVSAPEPAADTVADVSVEQADKTADDSVQIIEEEKSEKTESNKPEKTDSNKPEKESSKGVKEASTFIASAAAASDVKVGTPILSRRVVKTSTTEKNAETEKETPKKVDDATGEKTSKKEIRRNSKGFERFEDYFSDSADEGETSGADKSMKSPEKVTDKNDKIGDKESNGDTEKPLAPPAKTSTEKDGGNKKSTEAKKKAEAKEVNFFFSSPELNIKRIESIKLLNV